MPLDDPDPNFVSYPDAVAGSYVVTFASSAYTPLPPDDQKATSTTSGVPSPSADDLSDDLCDDYMATPVNTFPYIGGFVCTMTETQARAMSHDSRVAGVESDARAYSTGRTGDDGRSNPDPDPVGWALDRVNQTSLPLDGQFT